MKTWLIVIISLSLNLAQSAFASSDLTEVATAFKKLDTLKGYRITRTQEVPPQIMAQMAQNPQMAAMVGGMFKPTVVEFANPGRRQRFTTTVPSMGQNSPSFKTTTIISDKVLATLMEYASEKDKQLAEKSGNQNSSSVGDLVGIIDNPFGALGVMLFGEITKQLVGNLKNPIGRWTCTATDEDSPSDLSKLSSARKLGKSTIGNEPTMQYEMKYNEMIQIVDISLNTGLPLRTVMSMDIEGMGQSKMIEDYYDFNSAIKIDMPKCG